MRGGGARLIERNLRLDQDERNETGWRVGGARWMKRCLVRLD